MEQQAQDLAKLMADLVGEEKTKEVLGLLIDRIKTKPQSIKPKLQSFKLYVNLL